MDDNDEDSADGGEVVVIVDDVLKLTELNDDDDDAETAAAAAESPWYSGPPISDLLDARARAAAPLHRARPARGTCAGAGGLPLAGCFCHRELAVPELNYSEIFKDRARDVTRASCHSCELLCCAELGQSPLS